MSFMNDWYLELEEKLQELLQMADSICEDDEEIKQMEEDLKAAYPWAAC